MKNKSSNTAGGLVADAGKDQIVYAPYNRTARVTLDGSGGPMSKRLTYTWYLEGSAVAMGMRPIIKLIPGAHTVSLVVNNGKEDSEPSHVVITVMGPLEVECRIFPPSRKMLKKTPEIMVKLYMPPDITSNAINFDHPLRLYPGGAEVMHHYAMQWRRQKIPCTSVFAFFNKDLITCDASKSGAVDLAVSGRLKTGRYFFGRDTIKILNHQEMILSTMKVSQE